MNILEWRESLGLTQTQLAAMISGEAGLKVSRQRLRQWESGSLPDARVGEAIRRLSKGQVTWLPRENNKNKKRTEDQRPQNQGG